MVERTHGLDAPSQGAGIQQTPEADLSAEDRMAASSQVSQKVDRSLDPVPDNELLKEFAGVEPEAPAPAKAIETPAPAAGADRPISELAKDPAVRAALETALTDGTIKYKSLKDAVQKGLDTGNFVFKTPGQEGVVKGIVAKAIPPVEAPVESPSAEKGPEAAAPEQAPAAEGPAADAPDKAPEPQQAAIVKAIGDIDTKTPNALDERVKNVLVASEGISGLSNPDYVKRSSLQTAKPSLGDAARYANQMALKTENFEPAQIEANFKQAFEQPSKKDLYKLAEDQGLRLYPTPEPKPEGAGRSVRDVNEPIKADSQYGRAIEAAKAKGVDLPAPANPEAGYTLGEARSLKDSKLIDLDSVARARETPKPAAEKPLAGPEDKQAVLETLAKGYEKDGAAQRGLPFDQFKTLSYQGKNEVRSLVEKMGTQDLQTASAGIVVTAALAKEIKEKVLKEQQEPVGAGV